MKIDKNEEFIKQLRDSNTSISAFIKLFNIWIDMEPRQRREVIDSEIKERRLVVEE